MDSAPKRVSKACDACKLRKVKCNGQERCQQCAHLGLRCIYSVSARPRSQGKRGRIISEYKSKTTVVGGAMGYSPIGVMSPTSPVVEESRFGGGRGEFSKDSSVSSIPQSPRIHYPQSFFLSLLPDYMEGVYPVQPVVTESEIRSYVQAMDTDQDARSFIYSFGGATLNLTRYGDKRTDEVIQTIESLMNLSIETLRPPYAGYRSSVMRAMQSMFLHNCLMSMQATEAAFHYMRDSISTVQLLRIDNPEIMASLPSYERARRQRLYWQAYIHERFLAILDYRQAILPPLDQLPEDDATIPLSVHEGFTQIIKLFQLLDPEFLKNWLGTHNQTPGTVTSSWIEAKSLELEDPSPISGSPEGLAHLTTMQRADLTITREWLRTLVWRLAMSQALLSNRSSKQCLTLLFPVRLSQSLRHLISTLSREAIEVHGSSISQKLFEITDTIADVLIHVPASSLHETAQRIDDFVFIFDFVVRFPTLDGTRRGILVEKLERLRGMFPEVVSAGSSPMGMGVGMEGLDGRSPTPSGGNDAWFYVAQSKMAGVEEGHGGEYGSGNVLMSPTAYAASHVPAQVQPNPTFDATAGPFLTPGPAVTTSKGVGSQKAAWNHIHRRLSTVQFPDVE